MRHFSLVLCGLVLVACAEPGVATTHLPVVGGAEDPGDDSVPAIFLEDRFENVMALCTGTVISPRVVLTAAHCVDEDSEAVKWQVYFGHTVNETDPEYIGFRDVTLAEHHPLWNHADLANGYDFALLLLESPAPVAPLPINRASVTYALVDEPIRLVGFGDSLSGAGAGVKRQATTKLEDFDGRLIYFGSSSVNSCQGDSGGPNFMTIGGTEVVTGVTSFGDPGCSEFGAGGRVDAVASTFIDPWVEEHDVVTCGFDGGCASGCTSPDPDCPCSADGFCTTACTSGDDPDCPVGCGANGKCISGCPVPDPDCSPPPPPPPDPCAANGECVTDCVTHDPDCEPAGVGQPCRHGTDCDSDLCLPALDDDRLAYCTQDCTTAADCADGMDCLATTDGGQLCAYSGPTPGALGATCSGGEDCLSALCIPFDDTSVCSVTCDDADCPGGFDCLPTTGVEHVCAPAQPITPGGDKGGGPWYHCAVRLPTATQAEPVNGALLLVLALVFARKRPR